MCHLRSWLPFGTLLCVALLVLTAGSNGPTARSSTAEASLIPSAFFPKISGGILDWHAVRAFHFDPITWIDDILRKLHSAFNHLRWEIDKASVCEGCVMLIQTARWADVFGMSRNFMATIIRESCVKYFHETPSVCLGAVSSFKDEVISVLADSDYSGHDICGVFFPYCPAPSDPRLNWTVIIPGNRPAWQPVAAPAVAAPKLRILHIADIHMDPLYKAGSAADCNEPVCCRENSKGKQDSPIAGYWGYPGKCDMPPYFLDAMLEHIAKSDKIDLIIWTGDIAPHDVWRQSRQYLLDLMDQVNTAIKKHFPTTSVYAAIGNHESFPVNSFPPPGVRGPNNNMSWLYNEVADEWIDWGPDQSQKQNILLGAYYSHRPWDGLKIISLNTNYCNSENWWLLLNLTDPTGELAWFVQELSESERLGEAVYVISHIPTTSLDCIRPWRDNYLRIVARFENIIRGTFFGHNHNDEYGVTYDPADLTHATSVAYISPSMTTYDYLNPGYRVFTVDGHYANSTYAVLDHETYIVNLTETNIRAERRMQIEPVLTTSGNQIDDLCWKREYAAKSLYEMPDLSPQSWSALTDRMETDNSTFNAYWNYYFKMQETAVNKGCSDKCRLSLLCNARANACSDGDKV